MKRRWRFLIRFFLWSLLSLFFLVLVVGYWLAASGRLATIATHFARRLSGQDITIGATALRSWHTIIFTEIAVQADIGGWHLSVTCPEVAARVGLWGLFTQQVQSLTLAQPHVLLRLPSMPSAAPTSAAPSLILPALPVKQLIVQQGTLDILEPQTQHTLEGLSLRLRQDDGQLHTELRGALRDSPATLHLQGRFPLGTSSFTGTLQGQAEDIPLVFFTSFLPSSWEVSHGTLTLTGDITLQATAGQGQFSLNLTDLQGQAQGVTLEDTGLSIQATWQGNFAQRTHTISGATKLHLFGLHHTASITALPDLSLTAPFQLTLDPSSWHLTSADALLQSTWQKATYTLQPLMVDVQMTPTAPFLWKMQASLQNTPATIEAHGQKTAENATIQLTGQHIPLALLSNLGHEYLPDAWHPSQGTLAFTGDMTLHDALLQGTANLTLSAGEIDRDALRFQAASLTLHTTFTHQADTFLATGQLDVHLPEVSSYREISGMDTHLASSFDFTFAPTQWTLQAKPTLQSAELRIAESAHLHNLFLAIPLDIRSTPTGILGQGPLTISAQTLTWQPPTRKTPVLHARDLQGKVPLQFRQATLEIRQAQLRTGPWKGPDNALEHFDLQISTDLDVSRHQGTIHSLVAALGDVAQVHSKGIWDWQRHLLRDLQVQTTFSDLALFWQRLTPWLPAATHPWQYSGGATLTMHAPNFALKPPWSTKNLQITWEIRDGAFSMGRYATEKLYGKIETTVTFDPEHPYYMVQGKGTLQPFVMLIGSFLPDLTTQKITPNFAFTATYTGHPAYLRLVFSGDFDSLGTIQGKASLQEPLLTAPYDIELTMQEMNLETAWRTLLYDAALFPTLAAAEVQGRLHLNLQIQGQAQNAAIRGTLRTHNVSFATPSLALYDVNFIAPWRGDYPFSNRIIDLKSLPASDYGTFSAASLRIGNIQTSSINTRFIASSDNLWIPEGFQVDLLGGQLFIGSLLAQNFLQPSRRLTLSTTMHHIDLQQIPPTSNRLPLAGVLEGAFPRIEIFQEHLQTDGSLLWNVADGSLRLMSLHGEELFSILPTIQCSLVTEQPISLAQLTRLYPIGAMAGTLDIDLQNFTLTGSVPTAFQLRFAVRERGGEEREITLRALNNLLFTTGTTQIAAGLFGIGDTYRLPYRRFGAQATLRNDILQLRGLYHDRAGQEYFMQAPALGHGVSIINQVPDNGISFQAFMQRLRATVLEKPEIRLAPQH